MINTVAQGLLGGNRSLSVDGLLITARIWAWQSINPAKMKLCPGCHYLSHLASSTNCLQCFCIWMMVGLVLLEFNLQRCCLRMKV